MRSVLVLLSVVFFGALPSYGQSSISGFVRDAETGETLLQANVILEGTNLGTATNDAGYFTLTGLDAGPYNVRISFIGFVTYRQQFSMSAGENLRIDVELVPIGLVVDGITIEADREDEAENRRLGLTKMTTVQIQQLPSILEPDLFRSLQLLPGIKAASDYSSGLYIRGGKPDQTLILLDGTTVYNPTHFFGFFSTFNPDAIKDVRVFKGAYPAEYGGRIGSVIDVHNKDGNRNNFHGRLSLGLLASRALLEGPWKKGSWMIALRRSTLEPLFSALRNHDVDGIPDSFYFFDLNAKINYDLTRNDRLSFSMYTGRDNLLLPIVDNTAIFLEYGNTTWSAKWTRILSEKLFSSVTATSSQYLSQPRFELSTTTFMRDNEVIDYSLKVDLEYLPSARNQFKIGVWGGNFDLKLVDMFDGRESFSLFSNSNYASVYAQYRYQSRRGLTVLGGLRTSYFEDGSYLRLEPRLSFELQADTNLHFQLGFGRYNQFLTLITNEAFSGFDVWLSSSDGVAPAYGDQIVGGVKMGVGSGFRFDIEGYYRTMRDLFELDPFLADAAGVEYPGLFQFGDGYAYGLEFFLEKSVGRLNGFIGYTWSRTQRRFPQLNDNEYHSPKYDRTHDLKFAGNYDIGRSWILTTAWVYATGQAYTEPSTYYRLVDFPFASKPPNAIVSPYNGSRLPAYHRLDMGVERRGRFFGLADYSLQIQAINVYMRENVWFYSFDFNRIGAPERETVPQIPILIPNISLSLDF